MNEETNIKATLTLDGKDYVIVRRETYDRLTQLSKAAKLPELPGQDADGNYPAVPYARALLARKLIRDRVAAGLTQRELARRAGIRFETLCRLEVGRHTPSVPTIEKLERALRATCATSGGDVQATRKVRMQRTDSTPASLSKRLKK